MQACLRATAARSFQQTVRLRRRTDDIRVIIGACTATPGIITQCQTRRSSTFLATQDQPTVALLPERHAVPGVPLREQTYEGKLAQPELGDSIETWIHGLEVALPLHLRSKGFETSGDHGEYTGQDLARHLVAAYMRQDQHFDLLSFLGLKQKRWRAVVWIVNRLIEEGDPYERAINTPSSSLSLEWRASQGLKQLTRAPIDPEHVSLKLQASSMQQMVDFNPRMPDLGWTYHKGALGMVWRALGAAILTAASSDKQTSAELMPHVLELIAILHTHNIIPDAVYQSVPSSEPLVLQQPPTLHLLSNKILTAISDAAWRAQDSSNAVRSKATGAQYDVLGNEMRGTEFRGQVQQLRPEIWLELVLWSCLHGGWIEEGSSILRSTQISSPDSEWSLISWSDELLRSQDTTPPKEISFLSLFGWNSASEERNVEKTLSSELIAAYIDASINIIRLGIGERGMAASKVLDQIKVFKAMLDRHDLGLGTISWDVVSARFIDSGGISVRKNPDLIQDVLSLVQPFAREIKSANTARTNTHGMSSVPYTFDPSAAVLGLLHGIIRTHISNCNATAALKAFEQLQSFTDTNMKRSMAEFFQKLSSIDSGHSDSHKLASTLPRTSSQGFISNVADLAASYPNFYPQVPTVLVASLLDQAIASGAFDFADWLLFSSDADGPVVSEQQFSDPELASALIRYASFTKNRDLLSQVFANMEARSTQQRKPHLEADVLQSIIESQIELRRWDSVETTLGHRSAELTSFWGDDTIAVLARELMRLERDEDDSQSRSRDHARKILANFATSYYGQPRFGWGSAWESFDSVLAFLSSLSTDMFEYCSKLRPRNEPHATRLSAQNFDRLIEGAVYTYGSMKALELWQQWCQPPSLQYTNPSRLYAKRNDKGLYKLSPKRYDRGQKYKPEDRVILVESKDKAYAPFILYDRVLPSVNSVRTIVRGAAAERTAMSWEELDESKEAYRSLAKSARRVFRSLDLDNEDIVREMEPLKL